MPRKTLPFQLDIAEPCHEQWSTMSGSASQRFCGSCQKHVHNLAAMTPTEIEREVIRTGGRLCGRITRREDGSMVTVEERSQSPVGVGAGFLLASTLSLGTAAAQAPAPADYRATITGKIVTSDGLPLRGSALVTFTQKGFEVAKVMTDSDGNWSTELLPDHYDVRALTLVNHESIEIRDVQLHAGLQSLGTVKTVAQLQVGIVSGGIGVSYSKLALVRHPVVLLSYLRNRYLRFSHTQT
jgi:hypothetical protein